MRDLKIVDLMQRYVPLFAYKQFLLDFSSQVRISLAKSLCAQRVTCFNSLKCIGHLGFDPDDFKTLMRKKHDHLLQLFPG